MTKFLIIDYQGNTGIIYSDDIPDKIENIQRNKTRKDTNKVISEYIKSFKKGYIVKKEELKDE